MAHNITKVVLLVIALCWALSASAKTYAHAVKTPAEFEALSKQVGSERFVKFVIDIPSNTILYFDVNVYEMHTKFVFKEIFKEEITDARLFEFNRNYSPIKPQFILGYVVHHLQQDVWTLSFFSGDQLTAAHVRHTLGRVSATFFESKHLKFMPDSTHHERLVAELPGIETITRSMLYKTANYHGFNAGTRIGVLRRVTAEDAKNPEKLRFDPHDIVILPTDLPDISVVSGIISETFSTPLAHVALRARSWGIPHIGLRDAGERYKALVGRHVRLSATRESHTLRAATPEEIAAWKAEISAPKVVKVPPLDIKTSDLRRLEKIRATEAGTFGAKAANLGEVRGLFVPGFSVPPGFVLPMHWYAAHLARHGLQPATDEASAKALKQAIMAAPIDPALLDQVMARVGELDLGPKGGVFVRSSTNAEDLPGFNGAGLYDTVPNVRGRAALSKAIRRVWASVWNRRAYQERQVFGIDHSKVACAVLVQVGVNATAAGVLITRDLYNPDNNFTFTINAKSGLGIRVVQGRKIPEILLFDIAMKSLKVISRSDETTQLVFDSDGGVRSIPIKDPAKPVLNDRKAHALAFAANGLVSLLGWKQALDIEWLYAGEELYIVQVRPYISAQAPPR